MLKKLLVFTTLSLGAVSFAQLPLDFEIGQTFVAGGGQYPYALARANIALGPEILQSQLFLLPELGVFFENETSYWLRVQAVLDGPTNTLFADLQTSPMLGTQARVGVRFSLW